jgi:hypothetical protein
LDASGQLGTRHRTSVSGSQDFQGEIMTKLEKPLKREIDIKGSPYIVTITPTGMKLTEKGKRKGQELAWADLASGQTALAAALNASLGQPSS